MDDLVKEALPILRVIEIKVFVEQGRQKNYKLVQKTGSLFFCSSEIPILAKLNKHCRDLVIF